MRVLKENTAAIIIDVQERLIPHIYGKDKLVNNLQRLIKGLKVLNIPILVSEQYRKGLGETIEEIDEVLGEYDSFEKSSFSCCDDSSIIEKVNELDKKFVIIAGIEAHVCVLQTVMDLVNKGYVPVLVDDCVSSRRLNDKNVAIDRIRQEGAIITTYESLLFELCRYSSVDEFKPISKIVK